jgi:hypothetical protein
MSERGKLTPEYAPVPGAQPSYRNHTASGGGGARRLVGTHPLLLVVGASNHVAVPCLARLGDGRGEIRRLRSTDQQMTGSLCAEGFSKYHMYTSVGISRSASPILLVNVGYSLDAIMFMGGACI